MSVRKDKNSWWVDFRFNHVRYRKRSPDNSKGGAQAYEALLRQRLARGEALDNGLTPHPTFEEFAWKWFQEYVVPNNRFSEQRIKSYTLKSSLIPFFGKLPIDEIRTQHIEQYKARKVTD